MRDMRLPERWCETELGCIGRLFRGRGGTRVDEELDGLPCIRYGDLYTHHECIVRSFCSAISPDRVSSYTSIQSGDVVFAGSGETFGEIGKAATYCNDGEAYAGADTIIFRPKPGLVPHFVGYAVNGEHANSYKSKMAQGSSVIHISAEHLSRLVLRLPPFAQQQRIAEILSTVDDAIEHTKALIAKTQQIKAGLMHDLFTRGVTPDGQLRPPREEAPQLYKESPLGWIPKEWDVEELGQILNRHGGYLQTGPFGSQLHASEYQSEGVPVVMPQDINGGRISRANIVRISEDRANDLSRHRMRLGDIVIARRGELSRAAAVSKREKGWLCGTGCFLLRLGNSKLRTEFASYVYRQDFVQRQIAGRAVGTTMPSLNNSVMSQLAFPFCSSKEQLLIVERLNAVEHQRSTLASELGSARKVKSGLMHDLLTGRVRVATETSAKPAPATANV